MSGIRSQRPPALYFKHSTSRMTEAYTFILYLYSLLARGHCRFTEFLAGRDHVSPAERVDHEWNMVDDGESDSDTVDYTEEGGTPSPHR